MINKAFFYVGFGLIFLFSTCSAQVEGPTFSRQPVLLLKFSPLPLFAPENALQLGAEIAPPFGKFSFNFDYGTGKGNYNISKYVRQNMSDLKTTYMRYELRTYFSDWYPFYALDKKPFGRYWALEYLDKKVSRNEETALASGGVVLPNFAYFEKIASTQTEKAINLKFGKNFRLKKYFFIDTFIGIGVRKYQVKPNNLLETNILHNSFLTKWKFWESGTHAIVPNATAGFRFCLVI